MVLMMFLLLLRPALKHWALTRVGAKSVPTLGLMLRASVAKLSCMVGSTLKAPDHRHAILRADAGPDLAAGVDCLN